MKQFYRFLAVIMALLLMMSVLVACSTTPPVKATENAKPAEATSAPEVKSPEAAKTDAPPEKKSFTLAVSFMSLNNPFWVAENNALKKEIEALGGKLVTYDAQLDLTRQISQIEDAVASGVDGVFVSPYDWKGIKPALEACNAKKIPVVVIDTKVFDGNLVNTQVVSDNVLGGKLCAENLVKALGGKGKIAVIDLSTNMAVQDRTKGFFEVMKNYPDIVVVAQQDGNGSVEAALPIMENMIQANPDINGVFGTNDPAAIGAIAALTSANKIGNVFVVGIDGAKDACALIKEKKLLGTAAQYPSKIAAECVRQMYKILSGEKPDKDIIYIEEEWVNIDNVANYETTNAY